jgi:hypothetical protein
VSVKKMLLGRPAPYIFRTRDFGKSWTKIVEGMAERDFVSVVRADATRRGLLYARDAARVLRLVRRRRPLAEALERPARHADLRRLGRRQRDRDRHDGRGFYVLDDIAPLRQYDPAALAAAKLFRPADAVRGGSRAGISYWLKDATKSLTLGDRGRARRRRALVSRRAAAEAAGEAASSEDEGGPRRAPTRVPMVAGMNRFEWDLTTEPVLSFPAWCCGARRPAGQWCCPARTRCG